MVQSDGHSLSGGPVVSLAGSHGFCNPSVSTEAGTFTPCCRSPTLSSSRDAPVCLRDTEVHPALPAAQCRGAGPELPSRRAPDSRAFLFPGVTDGLYQCPAFQEPRQQRACRWLRPCPPQRAVLVHIPLLPVFGLSTTAHTCPTQPSRPPHVGRTQPTAAGSQGL